VLCDILDDGGNTNMNGKTYVNQKRYMGKYVALRSFVDKKVVASGKRPSDVAERAGKKGVKNPVIVFVPEKNISHIY
jgi:hypothetical protein